jgi:plastocyanin
MPGVQTGVRRGVLAALAVVTVAAAAFAVGRGVATNDQKRTTVAVGAPATAPSASARVTIKDFTFGPATVTVKAGSTVRWTNDDGFDHSIKSANGTFDSPHIGSGLSYTATFATPGTYDYICGIHNFMAGSVVVTP